MAIDFPEHVSLAQRPTPLQRLERTSNLLGVELLVKRDDLTGAELSGNKVRKLEFLLAEALDQGCDTIITGGGEQSNHCRATALAATRLGLSSRLLLRTVDKTRPPPTQGNILLDRLSGAEIEWIDHADWARRNELFAERARELEGQGKKPYIIPEGGSNALGTWGYVACADELSTQLAELGELPTTIVYACGSGGTGAGLVVGAKMLGFAERGIRVAGVNVCDDRDYFVRVIGGICRDFEARFARDLSVADKDIDIIDGYVGRGYAKSRPEELACIRELAAREALILDPVYTGKAYFGLLGELKKDRERFGQRIVFVHTGGIFGLFSVADAFEK